MITCGFVCVATGDYILHFQKNLLSLWKHNADGSVMLFGNKVNAIVAPDCGVTSIPWPHLGWPFATLLRYEAYLSVNMKNAPDFLYAMDADLVWQRDPWPDLKGHDLVFAAHPGYGGVHEKPPPEGTPATPGCYIAGGFWGGRRERFLGVCEEIRDTIRATARQGLIPVWHDETVLNQVAATKAGAHILPWGWLAPDAACPWYEGDRAQACVLAVTKSERIAFKNGATLVVRPDPAPRTRPRIQGSGQGLILP